MRHYSWPPLQLTGIYIEEYCALPRSRRNFVGRKTAEKLLNRHLKHAKTISTRLHWTLVHLRIRRTKSAQNVGFVCTYNGQQRRSPSIRLESAFNSRVGVFTSKGASPPTEDESLPDNGEFQRGGGSGGEALQISTTVRLGWS